MYIALIYIQKRRRSEYKHSYRGSTYELGKVFNCYDI